MDTLLFCYANDRDRPLPELRQEDDGIDRLLDPGNSKNYFKKDRVSYATASVVAGKLLEYKDSLCLFHFSGHAGSTILRLEDIEARGVGIAQLLGRCPNLKLVFLNGCSTLNHIKLLTKEGVKAAIIATSTPVEDKVATQFSLLFYEELTRQYSVTEALDRAKMQLQVSVPTDIQPIRGALVDDTLPEISRNQWYFYAPGDDATRWKLPTGVEVTQAEYSPNGALRIALKKALGTYDPSLNEQFEAKKASNLSKAGLKSWLDEEVLRRLPYPLSEPLRKLLSPDIVDNKILGVTSSRERLVNYTSLFESGVDLLVVALLAQVFDYLLRAHDEGTPLDLDEDLTKLLQSLMTAGWSGLEPLPLIGVLKRLRRFLKETKTELFVPDMEKLVQLFDEQDRFYDSVLFLHDLRRRLASPAGVADIPALCKVGEDHLVKLCEQLGFWANYQLESYKNIRVIRFFRRAPEYQHERVVLRTSQSYRQDEKFFQEVALKELWECQSVLLVKIRRSPDGIEEPARFLNLSPLVVDQNAYRKSDNSVFDLYSFHSAEVPVSGQVQYKHIARPEDRLLGVQPYNGDSKDEPDFRVLREQMRTLRSLLASPADLAKTPIGVPGNDVTNDEDLLSD
ncbi:MAG: CHAT domain-containing protein [Cytophagaceae bacterium]|nr:CHAT domain-containing protein [Cytophagaceae bacterium]